MRLLPGPDGQAVEAAKQTLTQAHDTTLFQFVSYPRRGLSHPISITLISLAIKSQVFSKSMILPGLDLIVEPPRDLPAFGAAKRNLSYSGESFPQ